MARSKVKSRSHHDFAHLQLPTNILTKYQIPTPCGLCDIAQTRFYGSRSLQQDQRSNQAYTMILHTYNPQPMSLPYTGVSTSYTLQFARYSPDKIS